LRHPDANTYSYEHVELARTNNAETFKKDYAAYVWLLRKLADDAGIPKTLDVGSTKFNKGIKFSRSNIKRFWNTCIISEFTQQPYIGSIIFFECFSIVCSC